jgi:hypothetical protein
MNGLSDGFHLQKQLLRVNGVARNYRTTYLAALLRRHLDAQLLDPGPNLRWVGSIEEKKCPGNLYCFALVKCLG